MTVKKATAVAKRSPAKPKVTARAKVPAKKETNVKVVKEPRFPKLDGDYNFPVELQPVRTSSGLEIPGRRAIVRPDTKSVLGIVSKDYQLLKNHDALNEIEKTLPISLQTRTVHVCKGGKFMIARYKAPKIKSVEVKKGDVVQFGIEIGNSYTGGHSLYMRIYALRLACLNGMTTANSISTIRVSHRLGSHFVEARSAFEQKVKQFDQYRDLWSDWTKTTPSELKMDEFLQTRVATQKAREIIKIKYETDKDKSLWGFFNAVTWYGTHILKPKMINNRVSYKEDINKLETFAPQHRDSARLQFRFAQMSIEPFYAVKDWK